MLQGFYVFCWFLAPRPRCGGLPLQKTGWVTPVLTTLSLGFFRCVGNRSQKFVCQVIFIQTNKQSSFFSSYLPGSSSGFFRGPHDLAFQAQLIDEKTSFNCGSDDKHKREQRHPVPSR